MICSLWHEITLNKLTVLIRSVSQSESYEANFVNFRRDYISHYKLEIVWPEIALMDYRSTLWSKITRKFCIFHKIGFLSFPVSFPTVSREV